MNIEDLKIGNVYYFMSNTRNISVGKFVYLGDNSFKPSNFKEIKLSPELIKNKLFENQEVALLKSLEYGCKKMQSIIRNHEEQIALFKSRVKEDTLELKEKQSKLDELKVKYPEYLI